MDQEQTGRVVVVTGASSGIGRATATLAAQRGDHVVLVARGAGALEEAAAECRVAGAASTLVQPTDVGDDEQVGKLVATTLGEHGRIDVVVNAAGVVAYGRTEEIPAEVFDGVLRTNLVGSVNLARHVVPELRRQGHGALVLVGSLIGHVAIPTMSPYVLSKWGVHALARQLRIENRDVPGLRIGYVAPGGVDTPIYRQGATWLGVNGRPPPPVDPPEKIARVALQQAARGRQGQVGLANDALRFGYTVLPRVYDAVVGPLFRIGALDLTDEVPPGPGNVLRSHEERNSLLGQQGSPLLGIARNLRRRTLGGRA